MDNLPEECVSQILSLMASPESVRDLAAVSSTFRSAADSDAVWEKFLPSDYADVVSRSDLPLDFVNSKKAMFNRLCDPLLIDSGRKMFRLERWSGKILYVLSARELAITWSDDPMYWMWKKFIPQSRFEEVVELRTIHWLDIYGKIRTKCLSPNTTYVAFLIVKISDRAYGLDLIPSETSLKLGNRVISAGKVFLRRDKQKQILEQQFYGNRTEMMRSGVKEEDIKIPTERADGWMEIELGEFFNGEGDEDEEVEMRLREVNGFQLKGGLVIEGLEIRPKLIAS